MPDGSTPIGPKKSAPRLMTTVRRADGSVMEDPDIYPAGTQMRLCSVAMALEGLVILFNEINDGGARECGVAGTLDLALAELTRINSEFEEYEPEAKATA